MGSSPDDNNFQNSMILSLFKFDTTGKIGYLSLVMLMLFPLFNFVLEFVDAQIHIIDSPLLLYDTFSMEVISPPFPYKKIPNLDRHNNMDLGSAAISSVTEVFSPIFLFTGGMDLRRKEHWDTPVGWFNAVSTIMNQINHAFGMKGNQNILGIPRGGTQTLSTKKNSKRNGKVRATLSLSEPFVPIESIKMMTLFDLTRAFQYAIESDTATYSQKKYFQSIHPRMREIMKRLQEAVQTSRGINVGSAEMSTLSNGITLNGNIDALKFCAAMRLFAEWRVVRQVPDGYKGFAVGMTLGQKDIIQNIAKIEKAVHEWIDYYQQCDSLDLENGVRYIPACNETRSTEKSDGNFVSPTLRQLLEFEVMTNAHGNRLPKLKEKSAGMGLLWVRRQLHYQTALFANFIKFSKSSKSTNSIVSAAYREVYDKFHGWAVQKIFNYSFQAAPEPEIIYRFMNPHRLEEVMQKAHDMKRAKKGTTSDKIEGISGRIDNAIKEEENIFQKIETHFAKEWTKIIHFFSRVKGKIGNDADEEDRLNIEDFVTREMTKNAHDHINEYLKVVKPLLTDLIALLDEMNMDDPTRV